MCCHNLSSVPKIMMKKIMKITMQILMIIILCCYSLSPSSKLMRTKMKNGDGNHDDSVVNAVDDNDDDEDEICC